VSCWANGQRKILPDRHLTLTLSLSLSLSLYQTHRPSFCCNPRPTLDSAGRNSQHEPHTSTSSKAFAVSVAIIHLYFVVRLINTKNCINNKHSDQRQFMLSFHCDFRFRRPTLFRPTLASLSLYSFGGLIASALNFN
jgi:hypothetical protein